jgi:hypothetical protein
LVDAVVMLSIRYSVLSPYTAFLVIKPGIGPATNLPRFFAGAKLSESIFAEKRLGPQHDYGSLHHSRRAPECKRARRIEGIQLARPGDENACEQRPRAGRAHPGLKIH